MAKRGLCVMAGLGYAYSCRSEAAVIVLARALLPDKSRVPPAAAQVHMCATVRRARGEGSVYLMSISARTRSLVRLNISSSAS